MVTDTEQQIIKAERERISRELHDELAQIFTLMRWNIKSLTKDLPQDNVKLMHQADLLMELMEKADESLCCVVGNLRTTEYEGSSLGEILRSCLQKLSHIGKISYELLNDAEDIKLNEEQQYEICKIFREALINICRYAEATKVKVYIASQNDWLIITIQDNGIGASGEDIYKNDSYGIKGMNERAKNIGGSVLIKGYDGIGTTVVLHMPLNNKNRSERL